MVDKSWRIRVDDASCDNDPQTDDRHLIRFFDVMRGSRSAAPIRLLPVMNIPLQ